MATLVDTNILIDILTTDSEWSAWSSNQLAKARSQGSLVINPIICAELAPIFGYDWKRLDEWLRPSLFTREPLPYPASVVAATAHAVYRQRGGLKTSPLPDFFIGAHAQISGHTLLTRDAARYSTYFPRVPLISP